MRGFIQDLNTEKIRIDELSYQPEKFYTEALPEVLSKAITKKINAITKKEWMACYDSAVEIHPSYLRYPREKVDRNFDNVL